MTETDNPPTTAGETLARERRKQGLTVKDVTRALHLPESIVRAIEQDRHDQLATIYAHGYIRNYARYLGVDPGPLLEQCGEPRESELKVVLPGMTPGYRAERWLKIATYALVTTVIVPPLVVFFVMGGSRVFDRDIAADERVDVPAAEERSTQRVGERIAKAMNLDERDSEQKSQSHLSASVAPLQAIRPLRVDEESAALLELDAEPSDREGGVEGDAHLDSLSRLVVELSEDSWVEIVSDDGQRLEFDLLRAGMERSYQGRAPFRILLGRASAVDLILDGEPVTFDGHERPDVAQFELDRPPQLQ